MPIADDRWVQVSRSEFEHERVALSHLQSCLGSDVLKAWTNLEFFTHNGNIYEIDLLLLTVYGFYLVEIKSWRGKIAGDQRNWTLDSGTPVTNPLFLANKKAKVLAGLLKEQPAFKRSQLRLPRIEAKLYLSHTEEPPDLPSLVRQHILLKGEESRFEQAGPHTVDLSTERAVVKCMSEIAGQRKPKDLRFGSWKRGELLTEGEMTQDYVGIHHLDPKRECRLRVYPLPPKADPEAQNQVSRAAFREFTILSDVDHPGLQKPLDLHTSPLGLALQYPYDRAERNLEQYVREVGERLDVWSRLRLLRLIAEALGAAHDAGLYHRALCPQNVFVRVQDDTEQVRIGNWGTGLQSGASGASRFDSWLSESDSAYVAPEVWLSPEECRTDTDIFSLGLVGYMLLTGVAPADSQTGLRSLLTESTGLRLSAVKDGILPGLDDLIACCTHPDPDERPLMAEDFLKALDEVERELKRPETLIEEQCDPLKALPGEVLVNGDTLVSNLGSGAVSKVFLVEREEERSVLKIARDDETARRLAEEGEILARLSHPRIVRYHGLIELGGRKALRLDFVSEDNLAKELSLAGKLEPEFLQRYGADLLEAVAYLEQTGISHRDIKPANMGTTVGKAKKDKRLVLYDFSLSQAASTNLKAGTSSYIDPFLEKRGRWDTAAERYAVGVTLHQMASGVLPTWGNGLSDPSVDLNAHLGLATDNFDPYLRSGLVSFFEKALSREASERFDNSELMRKAWNAIFSTSTSTGHSPGHLQAADAKPETPVSTLALSAAALSALEGFEISKASEFSSLSRRDLNLKRGLGGKTRRELLEFQAALQQQLGDLPLQGNEGLDSLFEGLLELPEFDITGDYRRFVKAWLSGSEVGELQALLKKDGRKKAGRESVYRLQSLITEEWSSESSLRKVRGELDHWLVELGGVATEQELGSRVLCEYGSRHRDPAVRWSLVMGVVTAATLVEQMQSPRWQVRQFRQAKVYSVADDLISRIELLGRTVDGAVSPSGRPLSVERSVLLLGSPDEALPQVDAARLLRLAVACSEKATLSARGELYCIGMEAGCALAAAAGMFLATQEIDVVSLKKRVEQRYPMAAVLPSPPTLHELLEAAGIGLQWQDGLYVRRSRHFPASSSSYLSLSGHDDGEGLSLRAKDFEVLLRKVRKRGGFLALSVGLTEARRARPCFVRRLPQAKVVDVERVLLTGMKSFCKERKIQWDVVLQADNDPLHRHWKRLLKVFAEGLKVLDQALDASHSEVILVNCGMLARYGAIEFLERLRDEAAQPHRPHLVMLLLPSLNPDQLPTVEGRAVPLTSSNQRVSVPRSWLEAGDAALKDGVAV